MLDGSMGDNQSLQVMSNYDCKRVCGSNTHLLIITRPSDAVLSDFTVRDLGGNTYAAEVLYRIDPNQSDPGPDTVDTGIRADGNSITCDVEISEDGRPRIMIRVQGICP
jgi:hypothetical protein